MKITSLAWFKIKYKYLLIRGMHEQIAFQWDTKKRRTVDSNMADGGLLCIKADHVTSDLHGLCLSVLWAGQVMRVLPPAAVDVAGIS